MKRLLLILILTFSFQSWTKADEKGEYAIEDIVLLESLLIYFDINEIEKKRKKVLFILTKIFTLYHLNLLNLKTMRKFSFI